MRLLALHVRGRQAAPIAGGLAAVAAACAALLLAADDAGMLVAVLGPLCAVSLLGFALGAADPTLERTTPQRWRRWRAAELGVCAVVAMGAMAPLLVAGEHAGEALRNLAGFGGLTALGVSVLGARLAWLAPTAWAFAGAAVGPAAGRWLDPLTWPVQTGGTGLAFAAALGLAGAALHTRGPGPVLTRS